MAGESEGENDGTEAKNKTEIRREYVYLIQRFGNTSDATSQLNILRHNSHAFRMNRTQITTRATGELILAYTSAITQNNRNYVRIFEQMGEIHLSRFL